MSSPNQALDDFCADAIREMRGMASFNAIRDNGNARRGRNKAMSAFVRKLRKAFPALTDKEVRALDKWAYERARNWSLIWSATGALEAMQRRDAR